MSLGNRQYVGENDPVHPRDAIEAVPAAPLTSPAPMARISASALILVGIATVLVAIWARMLPFIGPTFGFSADGASAWNLSGAHLLLGVLPGAVAFVAGVLILLIAPRTISWSGRGSLAGAGLLAVMAGAWFVVGPLARPVLSTTGSYFVIASPLRELAFQIGYSYGPGLLITMAGAFTLGWSARHQRNSSPPVSAASAVPAASVHVVEEFSVRPRREPVAGRGSHL